VGEPARTAAGDAASARSADPIGRDGPAEFVRQQRHYWRAADAQRFHWQTRNPVLAPRERRLLRPLVASAGERLLEIGCGEGANLEHLRDCGAVRFGVDFSIDKARFARHATGARTVTADAARLPFGDERFDAVLIRDLLHHVPAPEVVLAEAHRVLRRGGRLVLVEPNRASPLILLQAALVPAERGVLRSTAKRLGALLSAAGLRVVRHTVEQPFPIERVLLHPALGSPVLAASPLVVRALDAFDALAHRLLPARAWMYLVFEAVRPENP
jgi:SAM-dependent methyltransferase